MPDRDAIQRLILAALKRLGLPETARRLEISREAVKSIALGNARTGTYAMAERNAARLDDAAPTVGAAG